MAKTLSSFMHHWPLVHKGLTFFLSAMVVKAIGASSPEDKAPTPTSSKSFPAQQRIQIASALLLL
ncbi:MAG: hypothetical protein IPN62_12495 [Flavobacteriales bacterium]|nr:hypothetical protein [Flavobacteriales bacterium]